LPHKLQVLACDLRGSGLSSLPSTWVHAVFALLLPLSAVWAQPQLIPGRSTTVAGSQAQRVPELYALRGVTTVLHFDADIDRQSVQVDPERIKLLDVGPRSILLTPVLELGPGERLGLRVRYSDGAAPEEAHFALVSRPPTVDTVLTVLRRQEPLAACQAELAQTRAGCVGAGAGVWELVDRLAGSGVTVRDLIRAQQDEKSLALSDGHAYRLATGLLLTVGAEAPAGQVAWAPRSATVTCAKTRAEVKVRTVSVRSQGAAPGVVQVAVETELPPPTAEPRFLLELRGDDGRIVTLTFDLPPEPPKEEAR